MQLQPGTRLGNYEVLGPLGAGGMGEVYRASDTRLGREVAIKILPEAFAQDPNRLARFEREARLLASVNHPGLAAIYGLEEAGSVRYIAMELVPGETLSEKLAPGSLPLEESLELGRQIAEALEAAHEKGIVHRDLKPANVKVTPEGKVKVLDLGLAKALDIKAPPEDISTSPTVVLDQTRPGVILGTAAFMSPEQARGKVIDKRTDIWGFGCLLFEMLSGRRAFTGETVSDVLASILASDPDWGALPAATPHRIRELLQRCLQKDLNRRLRDIGDARIEIEQCLAETSGRAPREHGETVEGHRRLVLWLVATSLLVAAGASWLVLRREPGPVPLASQGRSLVVLPANVSGDSRGGQLLGDGLVETLSIRLNQVPGIQVVTPTAAVAASDKDPDPFRAAKSVGANLVVRPSVVRNGDRVRIIYTVWNVRTRAQVAGDTIDGSASDLFGMQDQLAEKVAAALKLPKPAKKTPTPTGLETASQQERYLQAIGDLQRYDKAASVDDAIRLLEALSTEQPDSALVQAALGRATLYKYDLTHERTWADQAMVACERARRLNVDIPEVHITLGQLRNRTGKPEEAIEEFQRAREALPTSSEALLGLAVAYNKLGKPGEAETMFRQAIALQPNYWGNHSKLGHFYMQNGQYERALEMYRRVLQLTPDDPIAYSSIGGAHLAMNRFDEAREAYSKSLKLKPTRDAYSNLGSLEYWLGHYAKAAGAFEQAVKLAPKDSLMWANLGDAYRWTSGGNPRARAAYERAIQLAEEELAVNPRKHSAHAVLAISLAKTGNPAESDQHMQRALELASDNANYMYEAAIVATLNGRTSEALKWVSRAVRSGFSAQLIRREPEFVSLRGERGFADAIQPSRQKESS